MHKHRKMYARLQKNIKLNKLPFLHKFEFKEKNAFSELVKEN